MITSTSTPGSMLIDVFKNAKKTFETVELLKAWLLTQSEVALGNE